ncbi:MAG: CAAX prenyl protease-related protein [Geobacteraceae bacterium]|nr:CAAX prenyl protease-related protein [Geobacteraceae bacterium]
MQNKVFCRVAPFALFMAFVGLEEGLRFLAGKGMVNLSPLLLQSFYPVKALSVALMLFLLRRNYTEIMGKDLFRPIVLVSAVAAGLGVFAFWIWLDASWATIGNPAGFNPNIYADGTVRTIMTAFRLFGAVLVVPVMEELFWRSFLLRYLIAPDFTGVPIGCFSWPSFLIASLLFGLEHNLIVAGILAGIIYNLLLYRTRSLSSCIIAHAITNLALGAYVVNTGRWYFW